MSAPRAFRYELTEPSALGELISGLRAAFLRVFTRRYGTAVADEFAWRVDLHAVDLRKGPQGGNPFKDALSHIRDLVSGENDLDLFPTLRIHLVESEALLLLERGGAGYLEVLSGYPGMFDDGHFPGPAPGGISAVHERRREAAWTAIPASPLGKGLRFDLVEGNLPSMRFASARRYLPSFEARCRRTAKALLHMDRHGTPFPSDASAARDFRRHLGTLRGKEDLDRLVARAARTLQKSFEGEATPTYSVIKPPKPALRQAPPPKMDAPRSIDHADVLESTDGRIFVAILYAGFSGDDRVHIQVTERQMAFVQNGISFGGVMDAPQAAIDLLRQTTEAIVVEVRKGSGHREVKARHVAVIRDDTLNTALDVAMTGFRNFAARSKVKQNQWMEN